VYLAQGLFLADRVLAAALLSIGWRSFFQIQDQRQNSAYHKHDRDQQHRRLPGSQASERLWPAPPTTQLVGASEALRPCVAFSLFSPIRNYATCDVRAGDAVIPRKPKKRRATPAVRVQYGALPYRFTQMAALEILIVTTRQSRRWIVPKGWPIKRLTPSKSAAREAFEEAGVRGKIGARPIGNFRYKKAADENGAEADCEVKVFPLLVKRQSAAWPESAQRVAQWVDPDKAISLIREPELKSLVAAFAKRAAIAASKLIY
jgi:8-oxo-dGTP pyrophosphatase MutT (NUDIX family)